MSVNKIQPNLTVFIQNWNIFHVLMKKNEIYTSNREKQGEFTFISEWRICF